MILRRKSMPEHLRPAWERFHDQAARVEGAREVVLRCLPVGRVDPAPVPAGLEHLRAELDAVLAELDDWKHPEVAQPWEACRAAVQEALGGIDEAVEVAATTTELVELLDAVTDVVEPLDAWGRAERHWLRLRTRA